MSESQKEMVKDIVYNMKDLNEESLRILKSNSEVLKARDALDKKENKKENEE